MLEKWLILLEKYKIIELLKLDNIILRVEVSWLALSGQL
jgi:hypothetical protein